MLSMEPALPKITRMPRMDPNCGQLEITEFICLFHVMFASVLMHAFSKLIVWSYSGSFLYPFTIQDL